MLRGGGDGKCTCALNELETAEHIWDRSELRERTESRENRSIVGQLRVNGEECMQVTAVWWFERVHTRMGVARMS